MRRTSRRAYLLLITCPLPPVAESADDSHDLRREDNERRRNDVARDVDEKILHFASSDKDSNRETKGSEDPFDRGRTSA